MLNVVYYQIKGLLILESQASPALGDILSKAAEKGDGTKWTFRTFKEVKDQVERERNERRSQRNLRKQALFERQERNFSFGSIDSDKIQGRMIGAWTGF